MESKRPQESIKQLTRKGAFNLSFSGTSGTPTVGYIIFQTQLFAVPTGKNNEDDTFELTEFPENIENLNVGRYRSSEELAKFMGRI